MSNLNMPIVMEIEQKEMLLCDTFSKLNSLVIILKGQ